MSDKFKDRIILVLLILVGLCVICIMYLQQQAENIISNSNQTASIIESENEKEQFNYSYRNEIKVDLSDYSPLIDDSEAWYTKYHFISHAGGGIEGRTYTNSLEAWELSYANGNRVFDADLSFTSDGVLVLRHSWNDNLETEDSLAMEFSPTWIDDNGMLRNIIDQERMNYMDFKSTKIYYEYSPMDLEDMFTFMSRYKDVYVAIDIKDNIKKTLEYIDEYVEQNDCRDLIDRIIISLYSYNDYYLVSEMNVFTNFMLRQYINEPHNYSELIVFCLTNSIHTVGVSKCYMTDDGIKLLNEFGIHIYTTIVDYISDMKYYSEFGADGAVTNWLYEPDWAYIK